MQWKKTGKLVGLNEVGAMLGVTKQRAEQLGATKGFPKPLDALASGPVWRRSAVEKWAEKQGRDVLEPAGV